MPMLDANWKTIAFVALSAVVALFLAETITDRLYPMDQARIDFEGASFNVEIARTTFQKRRGLQNRRHLGPQRGMLFHFPHAQAVKIWMKDTLVALDIIWLDDRLQVLHIEDSALPCRGDPCPTYAPKVEASYVLEINAGEARRAGIGIGDNATFSNTGKQGQTAEHSSVRKAG